MSITPDSPKPERDGEFSQMSKGVSRSPRDARSAAEVELEKELATVKDGRREDRFLFVVALVVIFNVWALRDVDTWTLPVVVGIIQLFALLIFARRMGVEEIHFWLNQLLPRISLGVKKPDRPTEETKAEETKKDS